MTVNSLFSPEMVANNLHNFTPYILYKIRNISWLIISITIWICYRVLYETSRRLNTCERVCISNQKSNIDAFLLFAYWSILHKNKCSICSICYSTLARKHQRQRETIPSSPEVEELSSGSGDDPGDPGDCLPSLESGRPYSYPPLDPLLSSHCRPFSGDTDRPSLVSAVTELRFPSFASGQPNLFPESPDTVERFLGIPWREYVYALSFARRPIRSLTNFRSRRELKLAARKSRTPGPRRNDRISCTIPHVARSRRYSFIGLKNVEFLWEDFNKHKILSPALRNCVIADGIGNK